MKHYKIKTLIWVQASVLILVVLPSFKSVRSVLTMPLYVSDASARGEAVYVMADGHAYWGRLNSAVDLYHMRRVEKILIPHEETLSLYNFHKQRNDLLFERAIDYLVWQGVPMDSIETIPVDFAKRLSSLSEAQQVVKYQPHLKSLVVVTSAPHTRRSLLCFQRSVPKDLKVSVYADSHPAASHELFEPLWIEYLKLIVYFLAA